MRVFNYTSLRTREAKIYDIAGYQIAGGLSVEFLKVVAPVAIVIFAIGFFIGCILGISINPFDDNFKLVYWLVFLALGIAAGCVLWYVQFAGYRLYQYLGAYFKPKKTYTNDFKLTEYKFTDVKVNAIIKNIL